MIALLVLISLLARPAQSGENRFRELQTMYDLHKIVGGGDGESMQRWDFATALWNSKDYFNLFTESQKEVVWSQIACEARPEVHDYLKRQIWNHSEMIEALVARRNYDNVNCNNITSVSLSFHRCLCDNSSDIRFCYVLDAEFNTNQYRHKDERKMGKPIYEAVRLRINKIQRGREQEENSLVRMLWDEIYDIHNSTFQGRYMQVHKANYMAEEFAYFTNNKGDISEHVKILNENYTEYLEGYCKYTLQLHRLLSRVRHVDIRFRILDDLLKMKFLSMVPFNFCHQDYLLSKCICDERSSAIFCLNYFLQKAALVFANQTMCDHYESVASTAFPYSIIVILLLLLLQV